MSSVAAPLAPTAARFWPAVVFAIDDAFSVPLTVAWQSLAAADPVLAGELDLHVLFEQLSDESTARLHRHADRLGLRVSLHPAELVDVDYPVAWGGARANYLRLLIPELFAGHARVVYLDADVVIRSDLRPLLAADLGGRPVGAVRDPVNPTYGSGRALPGWSGIGIPAEREYFNSGVLVIDVETCRRAGIIEKAVSFVAEHPEHIRLFDQDALNWALDDQWQRLDARWNTFALSALRETRWLRHLADDLPPVDELLRREADAAIVHFATPAKPWKGLLPPGPADSLYQGHLDVVRAAEVDLLAPSPATRDGR